MICHLGKSDQVQTRMEKNRKEKKGKERTGQKKKSTGVAFQYNCCEKQSVILGRPSCLQKLPNSSL